MTNADGPAPSLEWTGERYVPELSGNIRLEHLHRYLLARELTRDRVVLDIASGEGYGSDLLAEVATRVYGVDIAADIAAHSQRRYRRPNLRFIAGSCTAIPLADCSIDVIACFETLEHHAEHALMLREMKRILRPGGLLIVSSPNRPEYSEAPGYLNPYHARELDQPEFFELLRAHFSDVRLIGQRIRAGSIVGPLDGQTQTSFLSFEDATPLPNRAVGLGAPLYLIGIASDAPLPSIPTGIFEGGDFIWTRDHAVAAAAERARHEEVAAVLQHEIERRGDYIAEIERSTAHAHTFLEDARRQIQALTLSQAELQSDKARAEALQAAVTAMQHRLEAAEREASATRQELVEASARVEREVERYSSLESVLKTPAEELAELKRELATGQVLLSELIATRDALAGQIAVLERSHSWTITRPLRAARRSVDATLARGRKLTSDAARTIYRLLPLGPETKRGLKETVFRTTPWLVRHTVAYRAWRGELPLLPSPEVQAAVITSAATITSLLPTDSPYAPAAARRRLGARIDFEPLTPQSIHSRIKAIAFYLPQFHPIPENDAWWGKGFTEWHNVARGRARFPGHYQPHVPGELGFYDLRLVDVQRRQVELAKTYGLHGFCYHHYWFAGKRLLRRPLDQLLANRDIDFPFCLCWANENWTRRWDGLDQEVLIAQEHSADDDLAFIRDIEQALGDDRYITVDGRPLLIVYRPVVLPDARATVERWRAYRRASGLPDLFLVAAQGFDRRDPRDWDFDAAVEFAPNNMGVPKINDEVAGAEEFEGTIYDYGDLVKASREYLPPSGYPLFRTVAPMWDNEARRQGLGTVFAGSTPKLYQEWLENACRYSDERLTPDKCFLFINAWNEWAEGAHLEPDRAHGYAYLRATGEALRKFPLDQERTPIVVVSHDAYFHGAQRLALRLARELRDALGYRVELILCGPGPLTPDFESLGPVHDFSPTGLPPADRQRLLEELRQRGARLALCNTSVVGDTVESLSQAGFKTVSMIHELPGLIGQYGLEGSIAAIAARADRVVFPARIVRDRFLELTGMAVDKAVIRPQGLLRSNRLANDREAARRDLRATLDVAPDASVVLGLGFADRRKGIDLFVEAGLTILANRPNTFMVWVGHHDAAAFDAARARIAQAGVDQYFRFPGLVEDPDAFFAGADVFLMTSREDPFPLVVLDALDAGLPIIGFAEGGGFVELLQRDCGFLVPHLDTAAMAETASRVLDDPSEGRRLGAVGKAIITSEFSFNTYARELTELAQGPRVSVVVPNYNYAHHLPARLRSIIKQTYRPHEIVFLDDCSTDDSVDVARTILERSPVPFRIIRNDTNQGVYRQWLKGLGEVSGDLVWIAEADDDCSPLLLEKLVPAFAASHVTLAYCQSKQIDGAGHELAGDYLAWTDDVDAGKWRNAFVRRGIDEVRDSLAIKNTIPNVSAVLMRPPDLTAIESQLLALKNAGDWLVYVHLLEGGDVAFVPEALNYHRRHAGSVTIGRGGVNLMREILVVQQHILGRHVVPAHVEDKRHAHLQATYEYLGLHLEGPAWYTDHESLRAVAVRG